MVVVIVPLLVAAGAGAALWWCLTHRAKPEPNWTAVYRANTRGVGYMEQFKYEQAIAEFEEVVDLAPDWWPGHVNLGIALLNRGGNEDAEAKNEGKTGKKAKSDFQRAVTIFKDVLKREEGNQEAETYCHYCLGVIYLTGDNLKEARKHLEPVTRLDPEDAYGWYKFAQTIKDEDPDRAVECLERAIKLDPNLGGAVYQRLQSPTIQKSLDQRKWEKLLYLWEDMSKKELFNSAKDRYSELGRYCEVIGRVPRRDEEKTEWLPRFEPPKKLDVTLADGTRWAKPADFGQGSAGELRAQLRGRFGGILVLLDYDGDGQLDVFLLAAVVRKGKLGNLLLRNEGKGKFKDVTAEAGLASHPAGLACCVADFDNDGRPDLFVTSLEGLRLLRNGGKGTFEDVTEKAGLDKQKAICLGACFVDIDQDGDLDLVLCRYGDTVEEALRVLKGGKPPAGPGLLLYVNKAIAQPMNPRTDPPPLEPKFALQNDPVIDATPAGAVSVAISDLDLDRDLDVLLLSEKTPPALILNDRLLRFRRSDLPEVLTGATAWNGALVLDVDRDERSDLLLLPHGRSPVLLMHESAGGWLEADKWFRRGTVQSPPLLHAHAVDIDLDGRTDVVGLSQARRPVFLRNDGKQLTHVLGGLGAADSWPKDLIAVAVPDLDGDCRADVLAWTESGELWAAFQKETGHQGIQLQPTGHRRVDAGGENTRTNADGFGTRVAVQMADHWSGLEYTTLSAGLGQSRLPVLLGLGEHTQAEVVRLRWPDNVWQAEFNKEAGHTHRIEESNRKVTSCPLLFTWDGERFVFVTDFLGAASMGESLAGGGYRPPRPEESVKIEPHQLRPRDGEFVLKLAEPMSEVTYLDRLQLVVIDHPAGADVYPDERFASADPPATQDLLCFERRIFPATAKDHRGQDVTAKLRAWDRDTVDGFRRRAWVGFAEEHGVELDFADRLKAFRPNDTLLLCLTGWTDYAYPESIWAATQAGVAMQPPVLERRGSAGQWQSIAEIGFPAGLPRLMTYALKGKDLAGDRCVLRLRTNLQVYWDQVFLAPLVDRVAADALKPGQQQGKLFRATTLEVSRASLYARGCMQEFSPDGKLPTLYDYERLAPLPVNRLAGRMTHYGDVTELLQKADDRFVLFGPGDEVDVRFDAGKLPSLPAGWKRSYVLRTWGYCKDAGPFTAHGDTVEPLPFRAMSNYPYGPGETYPDTPEHRDYLKHYNTRQVGPLRPSARAGR
ncbi:MAG: VCBS repeat-containing protein [Planctomycetes bacterium]|nr:VCBS repeat-containing protein [Planctomycetota bacterium]